MKAFPDGSTHRRYDISARQGDGWAVVFLDARGIITTVSDYGNYGHWFGSIGDDGDIRRFLCQCGDDYLVGKIAPRWEVDTEATEAEVKKCILRLRRSKEMTAEEARDEWELLSYVRDGDTGGWWAQTKLGRFADPEGMWCERRDPQAVAFCERVMPRLCEMLRAELAAEKRAA